MTEPSDAELAGPATSSLVFTARSGRVLSLALAFAATEMYWLTDDERELVLDVSDHFLSRAIALEG